MCQSCEFGRANKRTILNFVKFSRAGPAFKIGLLTDVHGRPFTFRLPGSVLELLHLIDTNLGGSVQSPWPELESEADQQRYLISSLCEEAIASSEIEGAVVTRKEAKEMLLQNRKPKDRDQQMIVNNFRTIQMLNGRKNEKMTVELLQEIQRELTENAIDDPRDCGRFRRSDESIKVWDEEDQQALHIPPPAEKLAERLRCLCQFANNNGTKQGEFIHPVVRAIVLHFWLAYDHPFVDGNGRTARALFYWSMLRNRYWLVEYLTISSIIRQHPKKYARAYLDTEQDENDLTYFLFYHLTTIEQSIRAFQKYLAKKVEEKKRLSRTLLPAMFNERQQAVLVEAQREVGATFSYESHARLCKVTPQTARADLLELEKLGLLVGNRKGRRFNFVAASDLASRLRKIAGR
ncbi:MAG: Fic family protein [Gemmataceae bacterium]|nr:Fic family protein [Gemmataceae bacterium]